MHQFLLNYELKPAPAANHKCLKSIYFEIYIFSCISVVSMRQLNNSLTDNCKFHKLSITLAGETISFFFITYDLKNTNIKKKDFQFRF